MANFPDQIMPKQLKRETSAEVDGAPTIYNAKDYNRHHREIRAIQCYLLGSNSLEKIVAEVESTVDKMGSQSIVSFSGVVGSGQNIPVPPGIPYTYTYGEVLAAASEISVGRTIGFAQSGYFTKINSISVSEACTDGTTPVDPAACPSDSTKILAYSHSIDGLSQMTAQEVVRYDRKEGASFYGCQRGQMGTVAQDVTPTDSCLIVPGIATICLGIRAVYHSTSGNPYHVIVYHNGGLNVTVAARPVGTDSEVAAEMGGTFLVSYLWQIVRNVTTPIDQDLFCR